MAVMMGDHPEHSHGGMVRRGRRARGGRGGGDGESDGKKIQVYNAQGSEAEKAATDEDPEFKKGGRPRHHRRRGGHTEGHEPERRHDRERRSAGGTTGRVRLARGGECEDGEEREHDAAGGAVGGGQNLAHGGHAHHGHGGHHHDGHEHHVEHEGEHGVHHHGAHGHAVHHHGDGDIHLHKKKGGRLAEGGRTRLAGGGRSRGPYSSGRALSAMETGDAAQRGMEGQKVPAEPD